MRKVVQITTVGYGGLLYALCDDGTIWVYDYVDWKQVESIPQEHDLSLGKISKLNG